MLDTSSWKWRVERKMEAKTAAERQSSETALLFGRDGVTNLDVA